MVPPTEEKWFVAKWGENDGPQHTDVDSLPIDDCTAIRQQTEARMARGMQFTMDVCVVWGCRDCCAAVNRQKVNVIVLWTVVLAPLRHALPLAEP